MYPKSIIGAKIRKISIFFAEAVLTCTQNLCLEQKKKKKKRKNINIFLEKKISIFKAQKSLFITWASVRIRICLSI